jgi:hypothetical protein
MDGFDLLGSLTQATVTPPTTPPPPPQPPPTTPSPTATRYEQTDARFAYTGTWATFSTAGASSGSYRRANTASTSVTVSFNGTYLAWIATRGTTLGKAKVSLDGGAAASVNLAASAVAYQQKVWDTGILTSGQHTVKISWDGTNLAGKYISVDAFDVAGTVLQISATPAAPAPAPTRYEQKDTRLTYAGGWTASSSASASGGSFRFADSAASSATVTFSGSYLAWIAKKSPVYGKARVTLDGGTPVTVASGPSTLWQQGMGDGRAHSQRPHGQDRWTGTRTGGYGHQHQRRCLRHCRHAVSSPGGTGHPLRTEGHHFAYLGIGHVVVLLRVGWLPHSNTSGSSVPSALPAPAHRG